MFEESVESFIVRWRPFTADVRLFGRVEGNPLLECEVAGAILQVLERTGPYRAAPGRARMILNVTTDTLELAPAARKSIEATGISAARVTGTVILREGNMMVVDGGAPVVTGVHDPIPDGIAAGDFVSFVAIAPIHGFLVPTEPRGRQSDVPKDELM